MDTPRNRIGLHIDGSWTIEDALQLCESVREHLSHFIGSPLDQRTGAQCRLEADALVNDLRCRSEIPLGAGVSIDIDESDPGRPRIAISPTWHGLSVTPRA